MLCIALASTIHCASSVRLLYEVSQATGKPEKLTIFPSFPAGSGFSTEQGKFE
jgi:hypothetical protein